MTIHDDEQERMTPGGAMSAAVRQAQHAIDSAKDFVAGTDLDQLRSKAGDTASALYSQGRDLLSNSEELSKAKEQLSGSIRQNPLAAVGVAFTAGLLLAMLLRR